MMINPGTPRIQRRIGIMAGLLPVGRIAAGR
jgi:hypothetical protein